MKTLVLVLFALSMNAVAQSAQPWTFALSGDSRNCGDVIMPTIAAGAADHHAEFYWHLGDFRAIYDFDQDMLAALENGAPKQYTISSYLDQAWGDFLAHQVDPFTMPVYLSIGNHELYNGKTRGDYIAQFADWINNEQIRRQRVLDDPKDRRAKTYAHWRWKNVDFISLDNASPDQFDSTQMHWFNRVITMIGKNKETNAVVVGMHAALPDSLAASHSMSDYPAGEASGRAVYSALLKLRNSGKKVYVFASHSHFYMANVFNSAYWREHGGVLPGWIVGTAGAKRYKLPATASQADAAKTNVYGFVTGHVYPDGKIDVSFHELKEGDVPASVRALYRDGLVHDCFSGNAEQ